MIKYTLTSRGRSVKTPTLPTFELASTDLKVILKMFEDYVCDKCKVYRKGVIDMVEEGYVSENRLDTALPDNYNDLTDEERINILLNTQCGAEFIFETVEDLEVV